MPLSQLRPSSSLPFRTDPRKDGISIPNDKHFPASVIETEDFRFNVKKIEGRVTISNAG